MPFHSLKLGRYVVEAEHNFTSLKFKSEEGDGERVFSCTVTATSRTQARITNGFGTMNPSLWRSLNDWLKHFGFEQATFEREDGTVKEYKVKC